MVGLTPNEVRLEPYSPGWPALYEREAKRLRAALGTHAIDLQHIGSTAVPGLSAKPIIDMAVRLRASDDLPACIAAMEKLGYTYKGEYGLPGRHFFTWGNPVSHHVHVVAPDSAHWTAWIAFRDKLRRDPAMREAYVRLKEDLARRHAHDRDGYTRAKNRFIEKQLAGKGGA